MLTHTDKKKKKKKVMEGEKRWREGGGGDRWRAGVREEGRVTVDETREDRRTHTVAYVDTDGRRATA